MISLFVVTVIVLSSLLYIGISRSVDYMLKAPGYKLLVHAEHMQYLLILMFGLSFVLWYKDHLGIAAALMVAAVLLYFFGTAYARAAVYAHYRAQPLERDFTHHP